MPSLAFTWLEEERESTEGIPALTMTLFESCDTFSQSIRHSPPVEEYSEEAHVTSMRTLTYHNFSSKIRPKKIKSVSNLILFFFFF